MAATKITVRNDGSIRVEGDFEIVDQDGKAFGLAGRTKIGLCRCGHSENKPFCDGSHKKVNFQSVLQAFDLPPAPPPSTRSLISCARCVWTPNAPHGGCSSDGQKAAKSWRESGMGETLTSRSPPCRFTLPLSHLPCRSPCPMCISFATASAFSVNSAENSIVRLVSSSSQHGTQVAILVRGRCLLSGGRWVVRAKIGGVSALALVLLGTMAPAAYCVFLWYLRNSSYLADPLLDAYLEMAGSLIAFTFAANAMVRFRGTHDRISLILAFGFVLAGLIEAGSSMTFYRGMPRHALWRDRYFPGMAGRADAAGRAAAGRADGREADSGIARAREGNRRGDADRRAPSPI